MGSTPESLLKHPGKFVEAPPVSGPTAWGFYGDSCQRSNRVGRASNSLPAERVIPVSSPTAWGFYGDSCQRSNRVGILWGFLSAVQPRGDLGGLSSPRLLNFGGPDPSGRGGGRLTLGTRAGFCISEGLGEEGHPEPINFQNFEKFQNNFQNFEKFQ